ncbi:MAG: preprotein translocase subunit SecE [Gammaproteobacteria bacterium RIFCSPHIGHO2_12_FULL_35_23]|nr:MAG: preprotein translocase subunit SecE [Gammaproteobacteria bacterium RIFCSPHIGHO2_12_FULL_35_23]
MTELNKKVVVSSDKQKNNEIKFDKLKWLLVLLLLIGGLVANYYYTQIPAALKVAGWIVLVCVVLLIAVRTTIGSSFWNFTKDARDEVRRVVWPTRQETVQTTAIVFLMVIILALILWGIDSILLWAISWFTGHGG